MARTAVFSAVRVRILAWARVRDAMSDHWARMFLGLDIGEVNKSLAFGRAQNMSVGEISVCVS
jgi:hypothetical protein